MEIYSLRIVKKTSETSSIVYQYDNFVTFGYFSRGNLQKLTNHAFDLVTDRLDNINQMGLHRFGLPNFPEAILYIKRGQEYNYIVASNIKLTSQTLTQLLDRISSLSTPKTITQLLDDFDQHPEHYQSKLDQCNQKLEGIKDILNENIQLMLNRDEQIDKLFDDSERLENSAKVFYKQAKKANRCCRWF